MSEETAVSLPALPAAPDAPADAPKEEPSHSLRGKNGRWVPRARPGEGSRPSVEVKSSLPPAPAATAEKPVEPAGPAAVPDFSDVHRIAGTAGPADPGKPFAPVEVVEGLSHEASAEAYLRGGYAVADAVFVGRGEWQPDGVSEHNGLKDTFVAWQKARRGKPLPPGGAFAAAVFAYVCKRARSPNTAKTLVKWFPGLAEVLGVDAPASTPQEKKVNGEKPAAGSTAAPAGAALAIERGVTVRPESYFGS